MDRTLVFDNGTGGNCGWGNGNAWEWMWMLLLFGIWGGNGYGFGGRGGYGMGMLPAELNGDAGRQLLMNAIQGNGTAISQLASSLNCSVQQIQASLCNIQGQLGLSGQQIINAIQSGNAQVLSQLAACCCDLRTGMERGFSTVAYETQRQTCEVTGAIKDSTATITGRLDAAEKREMQDKIDALRERNTALTTQLSQEHQNAYLAGVVSQAVAPVTAAVAALQNDVNGIKCKMPETASVPYSPVVGVPTCVAAQYGLGYGGYGFGANGGFWG